MIYALNQHRKIFFSDLKEQLFLHWKALISFFFDLKNIASHFFFQSNLYKINMYFRNVKMLYTIETLGTFIIEFSSKNIPTFILSLNDKNKNLSLIYTFYHFLSNHKTYFLSNKYIHIYI